MNLIMAVDKNWALGYQGGLLCSIPGDLKYFKEKTIHKTVVMGRGTLESLPRGRGLPDRNNIVLTTRPDYTAERAVVAHDLDELEAELTQYDDEDVFVIGGAGIYHELLDRCHRCFVTKIDGAFRADRWFIDLDKDERFRLAEKGEPVEENGIRYRFDVYERKEVQK